MEYYGQVCCEHNAKLKLGGLCQKCKDIKPYMVFRYGSKGGYFWGPGYIIEAERGKRPHWSLSNDNEESSEDVDDGGQTIPPETG